jgi:serine/threonine protein kinase
MRLISSAASRVEVVYGENGLPYILKTILDGDEGKILEKIQGVQGVCKLYYTQRKTQGQTMLYLKKYEMDLLDRVTHETLPPLSPSDILKMMLQVSRTLVKLLNEFQLCHGDLKPDNLFLDKDKKILLGDFGHAVSSKERVRRLIGTADYQAPEVPHFQRLEVCPKAADVYALGVTLWMTLFQYSPFTNVRGLSEDFGINDLPTKHINQDSVDFFKSQEGLSTLLEGMLQRDPKKRPSMEDVATTLSSMCS